MLAEAARDGFLNRRLGYQRPAQPVQHGAGVLRTVFWTLGQEPVYQVPEDDVAAGCLRRYLSKVSPTG